MEPLNQADVEQSLKKYKNRDPELYQELQDKMAQAPVELEGMIARAFVPGNRVVPAQGIRLAETIVRPNARPVLLIRENRATTEFLGPDSQVWSTRIQTAQTILDRVIPAVGRVEVNNNPSYTWVGTGWLVADDIIVTNRHVAREFGRSGESGFKFRLGTNGGPMTSRIDFLEEAERLTSLEYSVKSILWIASTGDPDVAFLRVTRAATDRPLPASIPLAAAVAEDDFVATIGYPARDPRVPDQDLVRQIFGDVYDKKRLAPGQIMAVGADELEHDCSTLGGNSGSVLVNLNTGEAAGLHFSGLYMQANYAVPAPTVADLLRRVQTGELPGAIPVQAIAPAAQASTPLTQAGTPGTYTFQLQIPIEITVKVGTPLFPGATAPISSMGAVSGDQTGSQTSNQFENALQTVRASLAGDPDILEVRLGYRFKRGWITDERVVVAEVREKLSPSDLRRVGKAPMPSQVLGVGVDVRTAALSDQLEHLGIDTAVFEERAQPGLYREPINLELSLVKEPMKAIFHVSPDSGFPNLKRFIGRVEKHLTATMYEWDTNHISEAIEDAMQPDGNTLTMVTQRAGTKAAVEAMKSALGTKFTHVWASVGRGKLIPSAYHIKVASRDGEEFWLSSGNWKDSNQADIDPAGENFTGITPLRQRNREWHVIIENAKLAKLFQKYIEYDLEEAKRVPFDEGIEFVFPELFVPEAAFMEGAERAAPVDYFDPLEIDRELEIQPLLTPDRDARNNRIFMAHAIQMIKKGTQKIYVQNQSMKLLEDNNDEFEIFFGVLRDKQRAGVDVRIIFRDAREFGGDSGAKQQKLLERIKDFGIDTDFIRVQKKCHTKGIIVDGAELLLGSHNFTNEGSLFNRDASLLVRDREVAEYFERIFLFDWEILATQEADELVGGVRLAHPGEETPVGFRRVSLAELLGDS